MSLTHLDLFAGIGGFSLAASWTGAIETIGFVEIDKFCQKVLAKNFPRVPLLAEDIHDFDAKHLRGTVDIVTGGFPCQPYSFAGLRRGNEDDRALWPQMLRVIAECRPCWCIAENVPGIIDLALDDVLASLETKGYETRTVVFPACAVGAFHVRQRVFIIANAGYNGLWRRDGIVVNATDDGSQRIQGKWKDAARWLARLQRGEDVRGLANDAKRFDIPEPTIRRIRNGFPDYVDRIKSLGNAVVPQQVLPLLQGIVELESQP